MTTEPASFGIRMGGLMRCCLQTLDEEAATLHARKHEIVKCNYCSSTMRFRDGAWEWNHTEEGK